MSAADTTDFQIRVQTSPANFDSFMGVTFDAGLGQSSELEFELPKRVSAPHVFKAQPLLTLHKTL